MMVTRPIYVGDTINDVIAAKSAGMKCIFVGKQNLGDIQLSNVNQLQEVLL
jgi:phosphoglycolate phosphatase-like HAD superfamily hydrolase